MGLKQLVTIYIVLKQVQFERFGYQSLVFFIYFFDLENMVEILSDSLYSIEAVVAGEKKFQDQPFSNPWI